MSYRQHNFGLSAWTLSCQGVGEVLLGIPGKTLSNALSSALSTLIIKRQQQAVFLAASKMG